MRERDPRMVPGITAASASRSVKVIGFSCLAITVLAAVVALIAIGLPHQSQFLDPIAAYAGIGGVVGANVLPIALRPYANHRQLVELRAGYTTKSTGFNQFDRISSKSGVVIRPAAIRPAGRPDPEAFTSGLGVEVVAAVRTPAQIVVGSRRAVLWLGASALITAAGTIWLADSIGPVPGTPVFVAGIVGFLGLFTVVSAAIFSFQYAPAEYYRHQLAARFPNARVFSGRPTSSSIVLELLGPDADRRPSARRRFAGLIVIGPDEIIFFSRCGRELLAYLTVPRSRVSGATFSSRQYANTTVPSVRITVTKDNATSFAFTLDLEVPLLLSRRGLKEQCSWIVDWATKRS